MDARTVVVGSELLRSEFVRVFETHADAVRSYCLRRLAIDQANDAVSEVFVVAWRRRGDMPAGPDTRLWLYGVAHNVVRTVQRGNRRTARLKARVARLSGGPSVPDPESAALVEASREGVRQALRRLADDDREVLMLRAWESLSAREIATALDISVAAAEKRLSRALQRLRSLLDLEDQE